MIRLLALCSLPFFLAACGSDPLAEEAPPIQMAEAPATMPAVAEPQPAAPFAGEPAQTVTIEEFYGAEDGPANDFPPDDLPDDNFGAPMTDSFNDEDLGGWGE